MKRLKAEPFVLNVITVGEKPKTTSLVAFHLIVRFMSSIPTLVERTEGQSAPQNEC